MTTEILERFQPLSASAGLQDVIAAINSDRAALAATLSDSVVQHSDILAYDSETGEVVYRS